MRTIIAFVKKKGVGLLFMFTFIVSAHAREMDSLVYVWDFTTRDGQRTDLTAKLTEEFEEALIQTKCWVVLASKL